MEGKKLEEYRIWSANREKVVYREYKFANINDYINRESEGRRSLVFGT